MNKFKKGQVTKKDGLVVKKDNFFEKRKAVMAVIYAAKEFYPSAPRLEVKIAEKHETILGTAWMGENVIVINETAFGEKLVITVLHELVHAWFNIKGHDEKCPLMKACATPDDSLDDAWEAFKKYAKKASKNSDMRVA